MQDISCAPLIDSNFQYDKIYIKMNIILLDIIKKLNNIVKDINGLKFKEKNTIEQLMEISTSCTQIIRYHEDMEKTFKQQFLANIKMEYPDGSRYEGEIKNGKKEGKGILYYNNGDKYDGFFKDDKKEINGVLYYKNGNIYEGEFKNDKKNGKGTFYYNDGQYKGDKYVGDFLDDYKHGKGIYYFHSGNKYEGDWKNNKMEGKGIFFFNNGDIYEGDFKDWVQDGKGISYFYNGIRMMGDYSRGKPIGIHAKLDQFGKVSSKRF